MTKGLKHSAVLLAQSDKNRECICAEQFNLERVLSELQKAVEQGFETILVRSNVAVMVEDTQAAKALEAELDAMGICHAWEVEYIDAKHKKRNPTGVEQRQNNLCVSIRSYRHH